MTEANGTGRYLFLSSKFEGRKDYDQVFHLIAMKKIMISSCLFTHPQSWQMAVLSKALATLYEFKFLSRSNCSQY